MGLPGGNFDCNTMSETNPATTGTSGRIAAARELRNHLLADPHRPLWHLTCPEHADSMPFDPNGALHWKGRHHLFYIFQRPDPDSGKTIHCWGHVSSIDLVHWRQHPVALDVAADDPDRSIFSGNAFLDNNGTPTICYHGVGVGNCLAHSTDPLLEHWTKHPGNPIVPIPQPGDSGHGVWESWDPHAWVENGHCHAIFGGRQAAHFSGPDWNQLAYTGPFLHGDTMMDAEDDVSCPDFFKLGDKHVLIAISHQKGVRWWSGDWDGKEFNAGQQDRITWPGGLYFAPETFLTPDGRRILWGWVLDPRPYDPERGWSGVLGAPTVVSEAADGNLRFAPASELEALRLNPVSLQAGSLPGILPGIALESADLELVIDPADSRTVTVSVRRSPDGVETTDIVFDREAGTLSIDFSRSGDPTIHHRGWVITPFQDETEKARRHWVQTAPFVLAPDEPLHLRILIDRSVLEVHANHRRWLVQRIFPTRPDSTGFAVSADGQNARLLAGTVWEMAASNPF